MPEDILAKTQDFQLFEIWEQRLGMLPYFQEMEKLGPETTIDGKEYLLTGFNDYLGLARDPRVIEAACEASKKYGTGCGSSRFLTGTVPVHAQLEEQLADFYGAEACLSFAAGYLASLSAISALADRGDVLYFDRENHASLYDGAAMTKATLRRYTPGDLGELRGLLQRDADRRGGRLLAVDGVFSMSGQLANLPELLDLCSEFGARLLVDDAHSLGVMGETGMGTGQHFGVQDKIDMTVITFSKSLASVGGAVIADKNVIQWLRAHARPFIFTASLPPAQAAAALKALEIMRTEPEHHERLWKHTNRYTQALQDMGMDTWNTKSSVIPLKLGDINLVADFWVALLKEGVFTTPVIPPAVRFDECVIRTSITAAYEDAHIDRLLEAIEKVAKSTGVL